MSKQGLFDSNIVQVATDANAKDVVGVSKGLWIYLVVTICLTLLTTVAVFGWRSCFERCFLSSRRNQASAGGV
jgi:hypothetical protein